MCTYADWSGFPSDLIGSFPVSISVKMDLLSCRARQNARRTIRQTVAVIILEIDVVVVN